MIPDDDYDDSPGMGEVLGLSRPPTPEPAHTPLLRVRRRKAPFRLFSSPWKSFISPHGGERTKGVFFLWWHIEWRTSKKMANKCPHGVSKTVPCDKCITELAANLTASTEPTNLLMCPFCGGNPAFKTQMGAWYVECRGCQARSGEGIRPLMQAIPNWETMPDREIFAEKNAIAQRRAAAKWNKRT